MTELLRHNDVDNLLLKTKTYAITETEISDYSATCIQKIYDSIIMRSRQNNIFCMKTQLEPIH